MERRWRWRATQTAFENSRIRVLEDDVVQPDGTPSAYTVIEDPHGALTVVAIDDRHRIVLVSQHRYPIDSMTLEIPAGEVPHDADLIGQARRELAEETGIVAHELTALGAFAPWPARVRRRCHVVLARDLDMSNIAINAQGADESIHAVRLYTPRAVRAAIAAGEIFDGPTLASLSLYWAALGVSVR